MPVMDPVPSTYGVDIPYTAHYFDTLHPFHLALALALHGLRPGFDAMAPAYCEIGCGNGLTLNLLAAALPEGRFTGIDSNPDHVARARRLAETARLANVSFVEGDIRSAAVADSFDIISAHGVYGWVGDDVRAAIRTFVERHLRNGGAFFVSYNAQPSWSAFEPLRRVVHENMRVAMSHEEAAENARTAVGELAALDVGWFASNGEASRAMQRLLDDAGPGNRARYLLHEYGVDGGGHGLFHAQVRRPIEAETSLRFACSADPVRAWPEYLGPDAVRTQLAGARDPAWRETLVDYILQPTLRRDIYVRGRLPLSAVQRQALFRSIAVFAPGHREVPQAIDLPTGRLSLDQPFVRELIERTGEEECVLQDLVGEFGAREGDERKLLRIVSILLREGDLRPTRVAGGRAGMPLSSINRAILAEDDPDNPYAAMLAPRLRAGWPVDGVFRAIAGAVAEGVAVERDALVEYLCETCRLRFAERGAAQDGERTTLQAAIEAVLANQWPAAERLGLAASLREQP